METPPVRLRDFINLVIGVIIVLTPFFNGDSVATHGAPRLRIIAAAIVVVSLWIVFHQRQVFAECFNALLGAVLVTTKIWRHGVNLQSTESVVAGAIVCLFSISCAVQLVRAAQTPLRVPTFGPSGRSS